MRWGTGKEATVPKHTLILSMKIRFYKAPFQMLPDIIEIETYYESIHLWFFPLRRKNFTWLRISVFKARK